MRIKLSEKYLSEREDICNKLLNIIELDAEGCFLLSNLDLDTDKQNKILEMKDKIKIPYEIGDNDFYWLNCNNSSVFYIIPESILHLFTF